MSNKNFLLLAAILLFMESLVLIQIFNPHALLPAAQIIASVFIIGLTFIYVARFSGLIK